MKKFTTTIFKHAINNPGLIQEDLGTKDGLHMRLIKDTLDRVVTIDDGTKVIAYGKLERSPYSQRWRMYNLYVDKAWRGKKLANVIHLGAVHVYKHLESDTTMSMGALKAFRSLESFGYKLKMLDTETNKTVPFTWGPDGIPEVDGNSIEDAENYALYV
jgi:predicted GNAT family N-acyltransferase